MSDKSQMKESKKKSHQERICANQPKAKRLTDERRNVFLLMDAEYEETEEMDEQKHT